LHSDDIEGGNSVQLFLKMAEDAKYFQKRAQTEKARATCILNKMKKKLVPAVPQVSASKILS
jgi:predicted DNA-binding WGR domain protein